MGEIVVQPGDTLWSIAEEVYGSGYAWRLLHIKGRPTRVEERDGKEIVMIYPGDVVLCR